VGGEEPGRVAGRTEQVRGLHQTRQLVSRENGDALSRTVPDVDDFPTFDDVMENPSQISAGFGV
jgi:hypothetical protein